MEDDRQRNYYSNLKIKTETYSDSESINEAVKNARREDIVRVAAGNSSVGMKFIKAGTLQALSVFL